MATRFYTVLGWVIWRALIRGARVAKRKARQNRMKIGVLGVVALALAGGVAASRTSS